MTPEVEPTLWQQISGWLWGLLVVPLKMLWNKADAAASKDELTAAIKDMRENTRQLFANAEADRAHNNSQFAAMNDKFHAVHVELLEKMK